MNQTKSLSRREQDVVSLLLKGLSNKQIALSLGISERTVEFHLNRVYAKAGVASRVELVLALGKGNPVESTVESEAGVSDNGNLSAWRRAAHIIQKEVAMTIQISFKEWEDFLRSHPLWLGAVVFLVVSLMTHYALYGVGLYFWLSYVVLALSLGAGSVQFGRALKNPASLRPFIWLLVAAGLPILAMGFDQLYLNTVLRYTAPITTSLANISTTAAWVTGADGQVFRSTSLSATSEWLWVVAILYMFLLFVMGNISRKQNGYWAVT